MNRTLRICTIVWFAGYGLVFLWYQLAFQPASYPGWVWPAVVGYIWLAPPIGAIPDVIAAIERFRKQTRVSEQWRSDHCAHCNYDLSGITRDVCPECGNEVGEGGQA